MQLEHRCQGRADALIEVVLRARGGNARHGLARNLGGGGMFVELEGLLPPPCSVVDVTVAQPGPAARQYAVWRAMVVHRQTDGIGLMFDRDRTPELRGLLGRRPVGAQRRPRPEAGPAQDPPAEEEPRRAAQSSR